MSFCKFKFRKHHKDLIGAYYDEKNRFNIAKLVRSRPSELRSTNSTEYQMEFFQEASGNIMKILKKSINIISWWDMRRKTGSKIGWLGWSDSLIAEATGCHWWSTESEEWWQDLLFYVHSSPTVSLFHSMCSYSIFMYFCWTRMRWTVINDQHVEDIHWHRTSICNVAVYSSKKNQVPTPHTKVVCTKGRTQGILNFYVTLSVHVS